MEKYDLVVIGSGPAGQRAAIQAAKLGRTVLLVEEHFQIGGGCVHAGTIPSKTLREAVLYLSGWRQRGFYGRSYRVKARITVADLIQRLDNVGIVPDERGRIAVDGHYRTEVEHIYATGDVIGFPALASTSMEQGRHAACHAFDAFNKM